jgi:hypothetical protein
MPLASVSSARQKQAPKGAKYSPSPISDSEDHDDLPARSNARINDFNPFESRTTHFASSQLVTSSNESKRKDPKATPVTDPSSQLTSSDGDDYGSDASSRNTRHLNSHDTDYKYTPISPRKRPQLGNKISSHFPSKTHPESGEDSSSSSSSSSEEDNGSDYQASPSPIKKPRPVKSVASLRSVGSIVPKKKVSRKQNQEERDFEMALSQKTKESRKFDAEAIRHSQEENRAILEELDRQSFMSTSSQSG